MDRDYPFICSGMGIRIEGRHLIRGPGKVYQPGINYLDDPNEPNSKFIKPGTINVIQEWGRNYSCLQGSLKGLKWCNEGSLEPVPNGKWVIMPAFMNAWGNVTLLASEILYDNKGDIPWLWKNKKQPTKRDMVLRGYLGYTPSLENCEFLHLDVPRMTKEVFDAMLMENSTSIRELIESLLEEGRKKSYIVYALAERLPSPERNYFLNNAKLEERENFLGEAFLQLTVGNDLTMDSSG